MLLEGEDTVIDGAGAASAAPSRAPASSRGESSRPIAATQARGHAKGAPRHG